MNLGTFPSSTSRTFFAACVAALFVAGCTSNPAPGTTNEPERTVKTENTRVGSYDAATNSGCLGCGLQTYKYVVLEPVPVSARPDSVFVVLRNIYQKLGVEAKSVNPQTGEIGNRQFNKTFRLGGAYLHEYLDCGQTITGPAADTHRIQMSLMSYVTAAPAGSIVKSQLTARAYDAGANQGSTSCESTGILEQKIKQALREALPTPAGN